MPLEACSLYHESNNIYSICLRITVTYVVLQNVNMKKLHITRICAMRQRTVQSSKNKNTQKNVFNLSEEKLKAHGNDIRF